MTLSSLFRSLSADALNLPPSPYEEPHFTTGLILRDAPGKEIEVTKEGQIVVLRARLTEPEVRERLSTGVHGLARQVTAASGMLTNDLDPNKELQGFAEVLRFCGLQIVPGQDVQSVMEALNPHCPWLIWTRPRETKDPGFPAGTCYRNAAAVTPEAVVIECVFRQDRLFQFTMQDLRHRVLTDEYNDHPKVRRRRARELALAELQSDPAPAFFRHIWPRQSDNVEWSRGLVPPGQPVDEKDPDEIDPGAMEQGKIPVSREKRRGLAGFFRFKGVDGLEAEMRLGSLMVLQQRLVSKYGTLTVMTGLVKPERVFRRVAEWFLQPSEKEPLEKLTPGRMAEVLNNIHHAVTAGDGLGSWLRFNFGVVYDDAAEALAALRMIGADEMTRLLGSLAARAQSEGFDACSGSSWEAFCEKHDISREEDAAFELMTQLPALFVRWIASHPQEVAAGEAEVSRITAERPLQWIDGQEMLGGMLGLGARMMAPLLKKADRALDELESLGLEDVDSARASFDSAGEMAAGSPLQAMTANSRANQMAAVQQEFGSLQAVLRTAPASELLLLASVAPATDTTEQEIVRVAGLLNDFSMMLSAMGGFDYWLDSCADSEPATLVPLLQSVGSPLAPALSRILTVGPPKTDWTDLLNDHTGIVPDNQQIDQWLEELPEQFRARCLAFVPA